MPLNRSDFDSDKVKNEHPFQMLEGYEHAMEKEGVLRMMLDKILTNYLFLDEMIVTKHEHPTMVSQGLLVEHGERSYSLTVKSLGLLYSVYGKG